MLTLCVCARCVGSACVMGHPIYKATIYKSRYIIIKVILPKLMLVNGQHGFWKGPVLKSMAEVSYLARFGLVQDARTAGLFFFNPPKQCPVYSGKLFKETKSSLCVLQYRLTKKMTVFCGSGFSLYLARLLFTMVLERDFPKVVRRLIGMNAPKVLKGIWGMKKIQKHKTFNQEPQKDTNTNVVCFLV